MSSDKIVANTDLATVATFWSSVEANLARNRLAAEGISSCLQGEEAVAMTWSLTNAVGGILLQVQARDVERALACLGESRADTDPALDEGERWSDTGLDGGNEEPDAVGREPGDEEPPPTRREENADRAWRGAFLGLLFLPLQLYVSWLLLGVFLSEELLRGKHRRHAWWAAAVNLPLMVVFGLVLRSLVELFLP
jgi:hypothetical protein